MRPSVQPTGPITAAVRGLRRLRDRLAASAVLRRAARRRVGAWMVVVMTVVAVHGLVDRAREREQAWGRTDVVAVVRRTVAVGSPVRDGDVALQRRPLATVPQGALRRPPRGTVARAELTPGVVLTPSLVGPPRRGSAAALPAGTVGVEVSTGTLRPPVQVGDRVDVLAPIPTDAAATPTDAEPTEDTLPTDDGSRPGVADGALAHGALVIGRGEDHVTLAVRRAEAVATASAALGGPLALIVQP